MALAILGFLFAFWAHQDIKQANGLGSALASKAERSVDQGQVEAIKLVFESETRKLSSERRTWILIASTGAMAFLLGSLVAWVTPHWLQAWVSRSRDQGQAPPGQGAPG